MARKRRSFSGAFKAKVALAACRGEKTTAQLAAEFGVHTGQVTAWKKQLLEGVPGLFEDGRGKWAVDDAAANDQELYEQIGRGSQFTAAAFTSRLESCGIAISMDGRGRAIDNVFVERLWRSVKYEEVYLKDYASGWEAEDALAAYFRFYNQERIHQALDYRTPAEVYRDRDSSRGRRSDEDQTEIARKEQKAG